MAKRGAYIRTEYGANFKANFDNTRRDDRHGGQRISPRCPCPADLAAGGTLALEANLNAGIVQFKGLMDAATPLSNDGAVWVDLPGRRHLCGHRLWQGAAQASHRRAITR
jgi:hypothetical protein